MIHPGATSMVMEVVQEATQKRFALKQLLASRAEDRDERKAFEHEAKLGMELRHPNLIRVYEYVKDPVQPYFVMELFPGYHLKLPIARPSVYPMPKTQLHRIIEQAARRWPTCTTRAGSHRDVKPENILVNKSGRGPGDRLRAGDAAHFGSPQAVRRQDPPPGHPELYRSRADPLRVPLAARRYLQFRDHLL